MVLRPRGLRLKERPFQNPATSERADYGLRRTLTAPSWAIRSPSVDARRSAASSRCVAWSSGEWPSVPCSTSDFDALSGIIVLSLITILVMVAAAAVLLPQGVSVSSPADLAVTLEPAVGTWASVVFGLGIFGAAFSSLIGNATLGGALISDAFGLGHHLGSIKVKVAITLVMLLGGIIAIVFATVPIQLLIFAQAITILVVPFIGLLMLWLASDRARMGSLANPAWKTVLGIVGFLALLATAVRLVWVLFF